MKYQIKWYQKLQKELTYNIIRAGVMLILYILIKIVLRFVTALADIIAKLPILKQCNELGEQYME